MFIHELNAGLSVIPGIGPRTQKAFSRMGITDIGKLLILSPRDWEDRRETIPIGKAIEKGFLNSIVEITGFENFGKPGSRHIKIRITDETGDAVLLAFNRSFLAKSLEISEKIYCYGPAIFQFQEIQLARFEIEKITRSPDFLGKVLPVYPLTEGITQSLLRKSIAWAVTRYAPLLENALPQSLLTDLKLSGINQRLTSLHIPQSLTEAKKAAADQADEELFILFLSILRSSSHRTKVEHKRKSINGSFQNRILEACPYQLTDDQKKSLAQINADLAAPHPMTRLLQGEVGSGKTLVAALALCPALEAGEQVAVMAPTEVLSRQTADTLADLLKPLGVNIVLLTGSVPSSQSQIIQKQIAEGNANVIVGTHALFSSAIAYKNLSLVIIDEQHRFGVRQRSKLCAKAGEPDLLMMSATPIPRSLMLTAFADMSVCSLHERPHGRLPIKTHLTVMGKEQKVYDFVLSRLQAGEQAFFVYPLIDPDEEKKSAVCMFENLSSKIFPDYPCALIHSRLDDDSKAQAIQDFRSGKAKILVSTTVIEVGINIPDASCMVIEHAELFGLSALHQLRGRVGRGTAQGYCFLVYSPELSEDARERMKIMLEENDGFAIAEKDLLLRGPGELSGSRQSGYCSAALIAAMSKPEKLQKLRDKAAELLQADPTLKEKENLCLSRYMESRGLEEETGF